MHDFVEPIWAELTSRQRSIWLDVSTSGDGRLFQVGARIEVTQKLDLELLQRALSDVIRRHDSLRLNVDSHQPRQRVERVGLDQAERAFHATSSSTTPRDARIGANGAACSSVISPARRSSSKARNATACSTRVSPATSWSKSNR